MGTGDPDEFRELRARLEVIERILDSVETGDFAGGRAFAARTYNAGAYPVAGAVGTTFAVQFQDVTGPETEGAAATITNRTGYHFAVNLGSGLPVAGTEIVVFEVPYAFVFRY